MTPGASYCGVLGCANNSRKKPELTYFVVPREEERKKQWVERIGRFDILQKSDRTKYYVCSTHFPRDMWKNKRLRSDAVPSFHLPGDNEVPSGSLKDANIQVKTLQRSERATVRRWIDRFMAEGTLRDRHRPQPPRALQPLQLESMLQTLKEHPSTPLRVFAKEFDCSVKTIGRHLLKKRTSVEKNAVTNTNRSDPTENDDEDLEDDTGSTIIIKEEIVDEDIVKEEVDPIEQLAMKRRQDEEMAGSSKKMRMEPAPENFVTIPPEIIVQPHPQVTTKVVKEVEAKDSCLLPEFFMSKMLSNQNEIISILKNQVLLQNPDPALLTFLRCVGAKLQRLTPKDRKNLQDKITNLLV